MTRLRERLAWSTPTTDAVDQIRTLSMALESEKDLDSLLERIGDARFVLLGEASHGTSEYYVWRARLSKRLIEEKGFSFIAVEGDWPDCYAVNRYVKGYGDDGRDARSVLYNFERWPTWMWANWEIVALAEWLRARNAGRPEPTQIGFYGLDVYSLWESLAAVLDYLERTDPDSAAFARRAYRCFEPYGEDVREYARATAFVDASCEAEVVAMLAELRAGAPAYQNDGRDAFFNAEQNALVTRNAERYYRAMVRGGGGSWNVRDRHMAETLDRLMQHHGPDAKAIVWEHNTHIGDARATDMAGAGMVNVGQLVRERHSDDGVVLVGFAAYQGSVIAGEHWGAPMQRMEVPPAEPGSWEDLFHQAGERNTLAIFPDGDGSAALREPRGQRAIGVVYNPAFERYGNYVPSVLPYRYDALLYFEDTMALHPLHVQPRDTGEPPETYPWGV
jgi:erythromycin esterase-like protein